MLPICTRKHPHAFFICSNLQKCRVQLVRRNAFARKASCQSLTNSELIDIILNIKSQHPNPPPPLRSPSLYRSIFPVCFDAKLERLILVFSRIAARKLPSAFRNFKIPPLHQASGGPIILASLKRDYRVKIMSCYL